MGRSDSRRHAAGSAIERPRPNTASGRLIEFRDRPIGFTELEAGSRRRPAPSCAPATARAQSVALFLGNTPDHPVNFFGAMKAGARIVHLSPLDGEIALSHKLSDSGARVLVTSNLSALLPTALKFLDKGLLDTPDRLRGRRLGQAGTPQTPLPDNPAIITFRQFIDGVDEAGRLARRSTPTTSRCCNIPAAPPACRRARCSATAISPRRCRSTTSGASRRAPSATRSSA